MISFSISQQYPSGIGTSTNSEKYFPFNLFSTISIFQPSMCSILERLKCVHRMELKAATVL